MIINSSSKVHSLIKKRISPTVEEVWVLALNSRLEILDCQLLFRGTVDFCPIHPRDILRLICLANASAWIIVHNHPSGDPTPSRQDNQMTRKLWKLSQLVEIPLHDHLIVSGEKFYSYADRRFFQKLRGEKTSAPAGWKGDANLEQNMTALQWELLK
jgi:DNA repair protein RadC